MPDPRSSPGQALIRHPVKLTLDSGCRRNDDFAIYYCRGNKGRPSRNILDPSMVGSHFQEPLSTYCGGIDNLYRHHDYSLAILESLRPYPMARFWLHGRHLLVGGRKMSKSRGTVAYTDDLLAQGYTAAEIRFFLIYGQYREKLSFSDRGMNSAAEKLRRIRFQVREIERRAEGSAPLEDDRTRRIRDTFQGHMDRDLEVRSAVDELFRELETVKPDDVKPAAAVSIIAVLREIDQVLNVIF